MPADLPPTAPTATPYRRWTSLDAEQGSPMWPFHNAIAAIRTLYRIDGETTTSARDAHVRLWSATQEVSRIFAWHDVMCMHDPESCIADTLHAMAKGLAR